MRHIKKDAIKDFLKLNIKCYEFKHIGSSIHIVCLKTNDIIHIFNKVDVLT
jgi:hypothetical protein